MSKYELRQISGNWYGIWDNVRREFVIESTSCGIQMYAKMFGC